jgi:protein TonB
MTSNEILHAEMLDILFDNRNKQYGAYTLRKHYNQRLIISLAGALSIMFLLAFLIRPGQSTSFVRPSSPDVILREQVIPRGKVNVEPPKPKATTPSSKKMATEQFTRFKMVAETKHPIDDVRDLSAKVIGTASTIGENSLLNEVPQVPVQGTGSGLAEKKDPPVEPMIQAEPEFPGGIQAWIKFLNRNLAVPGELDADEKKLVKIRFQVAADGSVTNFEVVQSAGAMYDNEVIRVLRKMPKWKPAIQNNQPVARYFTQPVTFMGLGY